MKRIAIAVALLLTAAAPAGGASLPEWMSGTWVMVDGASWTEELWSSGRGGMMLGVSHGGFGPELQTWESMRIARSPDGELSLFASPQGRPPVEFPLAVQGVESVEFANAAHDYPQRIRYWRQGQLLMAETSKLDGSDMRRWHYRPVVVTP
ncbi:MAG: hypothetical protein JF593_07995 [Novosphingobium sp.]|nr:hypothetical protein [Novosphingobium sp.]